MKTEFFKKYKSYFTDKPKYTCENIPKNDYPDNWSDISRKYRKEMNWICSGCKLNLSEHQNLLHAHHISQKKYNSKKKK